MTEQHRLEMAQKFGPTNKGVCLPLAVDGLNPYSDVPEKAYIEYAEAHHKIEALQITKKEIDNAFRNLEKSCGIKFRYHNVKCPNELENLVSLNRKKERGTILITEDVHAVSVRDSRKGEISVQEPFNDNPNELPGLTTPADLFEQLLKGEENVYTVIFKRK